MGFNESCRKRASVINSHPHLTLNTLSCNPPYFITLFCLMPDDFILVQGSVLGINGFMLHTCHLVLNDYHKTSISTQVVLHEVAIRVNIMVDLLTQSLTARISLHHLHLLSLEHYHLEPKLYLLSTSEEIRFSIN